MPNPTAAFIVIGDEVLSGRTRDANLQFLATTLGERGISLNEVRVIQDDHEEIRGTVRDLSKKYDIVFTSGGIGPTHDDITADGVAAAFDVSIDVRDDARAILVAHYEKTDFELNEARLRMARIPEGATLIDNPVSSAPGFRIENVHVCAGVPRIFQAMVLAVLPGLATGSLVLSHSVRIERPEGEIAGLLGKIATAHPTLSIGSYPFNEPSGMGSNIVIRGTEKANVLAAASQIERAFEL